MHDNQLKHLAGWPDIEGAASIVRCIKQSVTIKKPPDVVGDWDTNIICWPFLHATDGHSATVSGGLCQEGTTVPTQRSLGGVQAWAATTGNPIDLITGATPFPATLVGQMSLDPVFDKGIGRLVGMGLEIINTTSPLNRQGLCTVYRQPQAKETTATMIYQGASGTPNQAYTAQIFRNPPSSLAAASLYPGSRNWPAEEGAYLVTPFIGSSNKPKACSPFSPLVSTDASFEGPTGIVSRACWVGTKGTAAGALTTPNFKSEPVHLTGAYFTGLSAESTLTVTWNVYYETFPSIDEREILVLATPSARYDGKALEVLNFALATLPVGVPASMNPLGEWFWNVVDTIADIAPAIGGVLGGPGGALIGAGVRKGAKALSAYNTAPSPITTKADLTIEMARRKQQQKDKGKQKSRPGGRDIVVQGKRK